MREQVEEKNEKCCLRSAQKDRVIIPSFPWPVIFSAPHGSGPSAMPFNYHLPRMPSQVSLGGRGNYNETPRQSLSRSTSRTSFQTSGPRSSGLLDVPSVFSMADQMEKVMPLPSNQFVPPGQLEIKGHGFKHFIGIDGSLNLPYDFFRPPFSTGRVGSRFSLATTRSNFSQSTMASRNQFTSLGTAAGN